MGTECTRIVRSRGAATYKRAELSALRKLQCRPSETGAPSRALCRPLRGVALRSNLKEAARAPSPRFAERSALRLRIPTLGIVLARLNHSDQARAVLDRAVGLAEQAGDFQNAGIAALTIIEQVGNHLSAKEVCEIIDHAGSLLEKTQDISTLRRLAKAAFEGLFLAQTIPAPSNWTNFSLRKSVLQYEGNLIKAALNESDGSVTQAARLLGFKHHQSLGSLISGRHPELLEIRRPLRTRRKTLMQHPKKRTKQT